ncbi:MAG: hypothetical protein BA863_12720 [Desulfovibrio sp. S3730MH75]|nr:MAG: hypothetical protein BA863_12720 [Desulfovibrio sp. S3730MH75]
MESDSGQNEKYWEEKGSLKTFSTPVQIAELKKHVSNDAKLLDVGCGYGRVMTELLNAGFTDVKGVEPSAALRRRVIDEGRSLAVNPMDLGVIPFEDSSIDAALLVAVLTCIPEDKDLNSVMSEIYRVLKPGGVIYINDFLLNTDERNIERYDHFQKKYGVYGIFELEGGGILRHFSDEYTKEMLSMFTELEFKKVVYTTMNGNRANGFYYIGKK